MSASTLDDILRKVQALLARADHPNTPVAEAEASRVKAELLMTKYRIDEATLAAGGAAQSQGIEPTWRKWRIASAKSEFSTEYRLIASAVLRHFDCEGVIRTGPARDVDPAAEDGDEWISYMEAVGYDSDLRMAEALYTSCQVAFQAKLEPKYDPSLSDQVNAYIMRSAGMEGWRIAQAIYGKDDKALRPKVRSMFKAEAIARGEDPSILLGKGNSVKVFRQSFAVGFSNEIYYRLQQMRLSRGDAGGALVLADRATKVREAYYERFPQYRPQSGAASHYKDPRDGCAKCAKAQSGYCREHQWLKPSAARSKAPAFNDAAYYRGKKAAQSADIGTAPGGRKVERTDSKGELQ